MPTNKSGKYVLTRSPSLSEPGQSCWTNMSNYILLSFASIVLPCGYSNDIKMYHPRIKGGLYIILNYLVNMTILGVTLGYTILHRIPNDIHGFTISNPSINVLVPSSKLIVETGGMDINVKLPDQKINLASMPSVNASFNTGKSPNSFSRYIFIQFVFYRIKRQIPRHSVARDLGRPVPTLHHHEMRHDGTGLFCHPSKAVGTRL